MKNASGTFFGTGTGSVLALTDRKQPTAAESDRWIQAKAAAGQAAATAERADMQKNGWSWFKDHLYFAWIPQEDLKCPLYTRCTQVKVVAMAPPGCTGGMAIDVSLDLEGLSTRSATGYSSGLPAGKGALVTITFDDSAQLDAVSMLNMRCS